MKSLNILKETIQDDGTWLPSHFTILYDDDDTEVVEKHSWHYSSGYAICGCQPFKGRSMQRVLLELDGKKIRGSRHVHHINLNSLDNRKENLQVMKIGDHRRLHAKIRAKKLIAR